MHKLLIFAALSSAPLFAGPISSCKLPDDKSGYHLFNPVPQNLMRELSTDRPDLTESPYTVDAGHFQIEMDLVSFTYDRYNPDRDNVRTNDWAFGTMNFKLGISNNVDFQLVVPTYQRSRSHEYTSGAVSRSEGFGDLTFRTKINLWGNDGGNTAMALMPFVKFPTASDGLGNDEYEGGLIIPFGISLPNEWNLGLMAEIDWIGDADGSGHHAEVITSITTSHAIVGDLSGYVEFYNLLSEDKGADWVASIGGGFTYAVNDNLQLDAGVNIGLTRAADDWNPFVGVSWRF